MASNSDEISPVRVPVFRAVWIASLGSHFGGMIQSVGASWLMISLAGSPQMVALVQASNTLPIMLLSLVAGAIADNLDRRRVMLSAQLLMLFASLALTVFAWRGSITPWSLLMFTFLIGCGTALYGPAWQASVGDMVPRTAVPRAVALNSMGFNMARSVGPAVGGAIVATMGVAAAFLANTLSYLGLIGVLLRWAPNYPPRELPPERLDRAMAAGIRYASMSPRLRAILFRALAFGLSASALPALLPVAARDLIAGGPVTYGLLLGGFGGGAIVGALAGLRLRRRFSAEIVIRGAMLALAVGSTLVALSHLLLLSVAALLLAGAGWVLALSTFNISVQLSTPRWVVARGLALYQMAAFGGIATGSWLAGAVAERNGVSTALLLAALAQVTSVLIGFILPLENGEHLDLESKNWAAPETAVPVELRSGPVMIQIDYRIAAGNVPMFLATMNERRRIRRRDGAKGWSLHRDLAENDLWIETYHVPTWLDYLRHNRRRTHVDDENIATLHALHQGGSPLVIHRRIERQPVVALPPTGSLDGAGTDD